MTKYYFVRHGESTANVDHISAGWSDVPLTDRGREQAQTIAQEIKNANLAFDMVFSSSLKRALDTAITIAGASHYTSDEIRIVPELREKSAGSLELRPLSEVFEKSEDEFVELGGENAELFRERVRQGLEIVKTQSVGRDLVLIVAHSGVYKMSKVLSAGLEPATKMYEIDIPKNADLLEIEIGDV